VLLGSQQLCQNPLVMTGERKAQRGIPDDTPENIARAVIAIAQEEATELGAILEVESQSRGDAIDNTLHFQLGSHSLTVQFEYLESCNLPAAASIGTGSISAGYHNEPEGWNLELLPKDFGSGYASPPFRWGLYCEDEHPLDSPTAHILDGPLLKKLINERLLPLASTG